MEVVKLFFTLTGLFFILVESKYIAYNSSQGIVPDKINVHLVPHSHDDVGWLKTVDQYYVGANNSIRGACVQNVLDSVISALLDDKNRKFIYVEMARFPFLHITDAFYAFFQRWWRQQSEALRAKVKELVNSGQLEFINGGMCMHDEATPHYIDLIDQTTLGHWFIKEEFGQKPRVGWQIDPFGHSAVQAYLLGAELGFDSLYFARIDYQDRAKRINEKTLEVVWQGSKSLGSSAQIFTGIFPRHYDPPDGFTFEINDESPPIQDDALLFDYNVQERVNDFVAAAIVQANITRTNHIMWTMGTDFRYQYAVSWFRQMDKFIHYVNKVLNFMFLLDYEPSKEKDDGRINALYSTPSIYTDAKYAANEYWPLKAGDFFPYADRENAYWTGYFTSRPAFKGYVRTMSAYYLAARQLEFFKGRSSSGPNTDALADALAIAQHHDAVSGTQRQHVAADYAMRISMGYTEAEKMVASSLAFLTESRSSAGHCPLLNISYCPPSEAALSNGKSLVVVVYNPLGWKREEVVRIPVSSHAIVVLDSGGREIESQLLPLSNASLSTRSYHVKAYLGRSPSGSPNYWLAFSASVPPLGFSTYTVSSVKPTDASSTMSRVYTSEGSIDKTVEVGQGNLKLLYSADEGKLTHYVNSRSLVTASAEQSFSYYSGYNGTDRENQGSGAYVFRPNGTYPIDSEGQVAVTVVRGPVVDEVHKQLNPWIFQVTRVYKGKEHAEIEFNIGPIPVEDGVGKEITTQLTTALKSNKTFYTDSNGRDFIKRTDKGNAILQVKDYRADWDVQLHQPIAGNYYPINLGVYLEDETMELSVLVDRAVGGSSLVDGQIELMLHRRLLRDDSRGVGEALNEEVCVLDECKGLMVQGKFYVRIDPLGEGSKWRRTFGQEIYSPLLLAFTEQDGNTWTSSHVPTFSAIEPSYSLPSNIAVLTLQEVKGGKALLRLAHLYETGEDKDYSVMTSVELKKLFPNKKITKVTEMNLSANQERAEMEKKRLVWKVKGASEEAKVTRGGPVDPGKLVVELAPMEIRTFFINFDHLERFRILPNGVNQYWCYYLCLLISVAGSRSLTARTGPVKMLMKAFLAVLLVASSTVFCTSSKYTVYNTSQGIVPDKLNVHLVPHTHDDGACVQNVLDSLIPALLADKNRKFVNGGMCMHDEAATHYVDMIDQTTLGHRFIKEEFGITPRIGWQIDPFGHSAVQAYLLGAEVGFDSLFFWRIDYQDNAKRRREKSLEVVWLGSKSLGSSAQIFTGVFPVNYEPPSGFYFDVNDDSPIVQDDVSLFDYNVQDRVNDFVAAAVSQANITRTNHVMWLMGADFKYQYSHTWFRQMDKLIHYVNMDGRVNALYSTPSIYTDAKHASGESWPIKTGDFFPYADRPNGYWTGYFTSRPALKRYIRMMSGYYVAARQLEFFRGRRESGPNTDTLADALAIAQHHDAVTGTEKQHVANDYAKRLSIGYMEAEKLVLSSLSSLTELISYEGNGSPTTKFQQAKHCDPLLEQWHSCYCPLLNISYCPATEVDLSHGKNLVVLVYNSLGWNRDDIVRIPVINEDIAVHDSAGRKIESQLLSLADNDISMRKYHVKAYLGQTPNETPKYWLVFTASVPPLGFSTYTLSTVKMAGASSARSSVYKFQGDENSVVEVGQGKLKLNFSPEKGKLIHYSNSRNSVKENVHQSYSFYSSYNGTEKDPQASGAYIFRPNGTFLLTPEEQVPLTVMRGPIVDEVHQQINPWIYQITRVHKGKEHVEVEFTVGPIPVDDGVGKEVATQITTTMETNKTFYTDSNGRDFIKRIRDYRTDWDLKVDQPAAGNYYPINLGIYMVDSKTELSVLVDRSVGGSSVVDGQIELMLHRRLLHDDGKGVAEALNERVCTGSECTGLIIQGKYYFRIDPLGEGAKWRRSVGQEIYSPLLLAFTEQDEDSWTTSHVSTFTGIDSSYTLPDNIAIVTIQELDDGKVLLRLAHLYESGEDKDLSVMTSVELIKLFPGKKIGKVTEMSLSANQERAEMEKKRLVWKVERSSGPRVVRGGRVDPTKLVVELAPMEIRTFVIDFENDRVFSSNVVDT
ncbi:hypothetical protein RJ640_028207 [Escallonia rubra]|uniref:alpha-mannosidase n=1 Tax=Escallonia rubra TaxID=112253 RepID=A0AA88QNY2_9ASTE|nr:hypothetical protein RJ640_028207 [Escallonia rubra]